MYNGGRVFRSSPNVNHIVHQGNFEGRIQKVDMLSVAHSDIKLKWLKEKKKERKRKKNKMKNAGRAY